MLRRVPAWFAALLVAATAVVGLAAPASAHATLVSTDPAEGEVLASSPGEVTFTFDEPVQLVPDGLLAFDAAGDEVDVDASASGTEVKGDLPDDLDEGTYVVTWRVVSADGHPIAGSLTFHVGAPSPKVEAPKVAPADPGVVPTVQAVVQGINYAALLVAGGLAAFLAWTVRDLRLPDAVRRRLVRTLRAELGTDIGTIARVARQLGYGLESVRAWVRQAEIDEGHAPGVSTDEAARVKALEQENRELRRANEILRRAATFFGAELDRQQR